MATDNKRKLYDALSQDYDMGSYEKFCADINDEGKRRKLYDATSADYDFGSWESFSRQLGYGQAAAPKQQTQAASTTPTANQASAQAAQAGWQPSEQEKIRMRAKLNAINDDFNRKTTAAQEQIHRVVERNTPEGRRKLETAKRLVQAAGITTTQANDNTPWKPTEQQKIALSHRLHQMQAERDAQFAEASERVDNVLEYHRNKRGNGFHAVEGPPVFNLETGKMEKTYLTPTGERTTSKAVADMVTLRYHRAVAAADMSVGAQIRRTEAELDKLRKQLNESASRVHKEWADDHKKNGAPLASVLSAKTYVPRQLSDKENAALRVAIRQREEQLKNLYEERDRQIGKDVGFWRGFGRTISDVRTWDFGVGDAMDAMTKLNVDKYSAPDASEGEKRAGQEMLKAVYDAQQTEQMFGDNASFWNRAGVMTGYMPSFMLDFALTGGYDALNVAGKAATRGSAKLIGEAAIKEMGELGVKKYAAKYGARGVGRMAENWTIKALGTAGDELLIRAPLMTNTIQAGKTAADIIDRKLGDVVVDQNGNYNYAKDKTWGSAIWQGEANAIIENYSEMFGSHLDGLVPALAKTFGGKRISGMLARANASSYGQIFATTRKQFQRMGVSDYFGEVSEEYYGQLWRSMLNLDDAYTNVPVYDEQGNQVFDEQGNPVYERKNLLFTGKFHGDIWGGMALSMGLIGAGKYAAPGIAYAKMKHQVNVADRTAAEIFTPERWKPIREIIDNTTNDDIGALAENMVNDPNMSDKERGAVMEYMERSINLRGLNLGTLAKSRGTTDGDPEHETGSRMAAREAHERGYNATTEEEREGAMRAWSYHNSRVGKMLGNYDVPKMLEEEFGTSDTEAVLEQLPTSRFNAAEREAIAEYVKATETFHSALDRMRADAEEAIERENAFIEKASHEDGHVRPATTKGDERQVYVVKGNVIMTEDGTMIDTSASDDVIYLYDPATDKVEQSSPGQLASLGQASLVEESRQEATDRIYQELTQGQNRLFGHIDFAPGEEYSLSLNHGEEPRTIKILSVDADDNVTFEVEGEKEPQSKTSYELSTLIDSYKQEQFNAEMEQKAASSAAPAEGAVEAPAEGAVESPTDEAQSPQAAVAIKYEPGDNLRVAVFGREETQHAAVVDRSGDVVTIWTPFPLSEKSEKSRTMPGCTTDISRKELDALVERDEQGKPVDYIPANPEVEPEEAAESGINGENSLPLQSNNENDGKGFEQNNDGERSTDGSRVADDSAGGMAGTRNRGDIRVYTQGLASSHNEYSEHSARDRREAESQRLVGIAKANGQFKTREEVRALGLKQPGSTGESEVVIDEANGVVYKIKDPYAKSPMKSGVRPEDAIVEHLVHNKYFPETAYQFEGISEDIGDVRIVLSQGFVPGVDRPTQKQIDEALAEKGLQPEGKYSYGNDEISVTDVTGDNAVLGKDGKVYFIDPIINFKKPVKEILGSEVYESAAKEAETSTAVAATEGPALDRVSKEEQVEAMPMRQVREKGETWEEPDYMATSPARSHKYIYNESGLSRQEADEHVEHMSKTAKEAVERHKKKAPKIGGSIGRFQKAKAEWEKTGVELQHAVEYWDAVKAEQRKVVDAERAAREEQAGQDHDAAVARFEEQQRVKAEKLAEQQARGAYTPHPDIKKKYDESPKFYGSETFITLADGTVVPGRFVYHEAFAVTPSHDPLNGFKISEGSPLTPEGRSANPRQYDVDKDAQRYTENGAREGYDARGIRNDKIVQDGNMLSGNGGQQMRQLAAKYGTDAAFIEALKRKAAEEGVTAEQLAQLEHPDRSFEPYEKFDYTPETYDRFNQDEKKSMNRDEQSVRLGMTVSDKAMQRMMNIIGRFDTIDDFYRHDVSANKVLGILLEENIIHENELGKYRDGEELSATAQNLIENLLVGKIFDSNPDAVRKLSKYKMVRKTVISAMSEIASNRTLQDKAYMLNEELAAAIDLVYQAKRASDAFGYGVPVSPFGRQMGLFDDEYGDSRVTDATTLLLADVLNSGKPSELRKILATYNANAQQSANGQKDIFSGSIPTKEEILKDVNNHFRNATPKELQAMVDAAIADRKQRAETNTSEGPVDGGQGTPQAPDAVQSGETGAKPTERGRGAVLSVAERGGQGDLQDTQRPEQDHIQQTKTEELDYEYNLSDELDQNGRPFVLNSKGEIEYGRIEEQHGLTEAPILLSEGIITNPKTKDGYGLIHIEARHGKQIRQNGYANAIEFIEDVANHWESIMEAKDRNGNPTFRLIAKGKHNNTIMVELSGDGTYWNINTAGIFKTSYGKNAKEVYNRHTTAKQPAEDVGESPESVQRGTTESASMDSPTLLSAGKGNTLPGDKQDITEKSSLAERDREIDAEPIPGEPTDKSQHVEAPRERSEAKQLGADNLPSKEKLSSMSYDVVVETASDYDMSIAERYDAMIEPLETEKAIIENKDRRKPQEGKRLKAIDKEIAEIERRKEEERLAVGKYFSDEIRKRWKSGEHSMSAEDMEKDMFLDEADAAAARMAQAKDVDNQGNPVDHAGKLIVEDVKSIEEITDKDFTEPMRTVALPTIPKNVAEAIGANGKKVIIKKNIFGKNHNNHKELTPVESREILRTALYTPSLYGQNQKQTRPFNWILIHLADKNTCVLLEVDSNKENCEIVNWHYLGEEQLKQKERQAEREGGRILTLSENNAAGNTSQGLSSDGKGNTSSAKNQEKASEGTRETSVQGQEPNGNKLVSDERAATIRERLRQKLGGEANEGIDSELLSLGAEMAVYQIENGAEKFEDFARVMREELGDGVSPYLKVFYNAARDMPEAQAAGLSARMDARETVDKTDLSGGSGRSVIARADHWVRERTAQKQADALIEENGGVKFDDESTAPREPDDSLEPDGIIDSFCERFSEFLDNTDGLDDAMAEGLEQTFIEEKRRAEQILSESLERGGVEAADAERIAQESIRNAMADVTLARSQRAAKALWRTATPIEELKLLAGDKNKGEAYTSAAEHEQKLSDEAKSQDDNGERGDYKTQAGEIVSYLSYGKFRKLRAGETCHVERKFRTTKEFGFTGKDRVESAEDVAYIFRELESYSTEHSFVALIKDGKPTIIQLGMGTESATVVSMTGIRGAYDALGGAEAVYFVHNHPAGTLRTSPQDEALMRKVRAMLPTGVICEGLIMDTTSGRYAKFTADGASETFQRPEEQDGREVIVHRFSKSVFGAGYNPDMTAIRTSDDVVAIVNSQRLGQRDKQNLLVMNNQGVVTGCFVLDAKSDLNALADEAVGLTVRFGGSKMILFGNKPMKEGDFAEFQRSVDRLSGGNIKTLDNVAVTNGLNSEPQKQTAEKEKRADAPTTGAEHKLEEGGKKADLKGLQDFGEKLVGARKDMLHDIASELENSTEAAFTELPLAKAFKRPNSRKLVEAGAMTEEEAMMVDAYSLAILSDTKPIVGRSRAARRSGSLTAAREERKMSAWASKQRKRVEALREFMEADSAKRALMIEQARSYHGELPEAEGTMTAYVERYADPIGIAIKLLDESGIEAGEKLQPVNIHLFKRGNYWSLSTGKNTHKPMGADFDQAVAEIKAALMLRNGKEGVELPPRLFNIRVTERERIPSGKYEVLYVRGRKYDIARKEFANKEEAEEFRKSLGGESHLNEIMTPGAAKKVVIEVVDPISGEKHRLGGEYGSKEEASIALEERHDELNTEACNLISEAHKIKRTAQSEFEVRHFPARGTEPECWGVTLRKPTAFGNLISTHATEAEAKAEMKRLEENLKSLEEKRKGLVYFNPETERKGKDYRKGKDATPEQFMETFGFRGVQFGNWTNQNDRQAALNQAYDGLMDLSEVTGLPTRALSLNGELGLAFGSRGSGSALAHYEPSTIVINLTKTRGAGSLAHEWWHAFDHYFSRKGGFMLGYATETRPGGEVRDAIAGQFVSLSQAVRNSHYARRSADRGAYWGSMRELTARLFAEWANKRMRARGETSPFLSRGVSEKLLERYKELNWLVYNARASRKNRYTGDVKVMTREEFMASPEALKGFPEPTKEEVAKFSEYLEDLFGMVDTRENSGKLELFEPEAEYERAKAAEIPVGAEVMRIEGEPGSAEEPEAVRARAIIAQQAVVIEPHSYNKEELRQIYSKLRPVEKDGNQVNFYISAFKKNFRPDGNFAKLVPQLSQLLDSAIFAYREVERGGGEMRRDGTQHKAHNNIINRDNYVAKAKIGDKEYYVRFNVQNQRGASGVHSTMVTNVEVYENPAMTTSLPTVHRGRLTMTGLSMQSYNNFLNWQILHRQHGWRIGIHRSRCRRRALSIGLPRKGLNM